MKGVQGNQAAQVRMFAHDAIPVAIGAINKENGITVDSGGYGYKVGDEETLTVASGTAATIKVTGVGKQDIINVQAQSGQQFYLNGRQLGTDKLVLLRGKTYTFYQKASSNSGHVLAFSSTEPTSAGTTTPYTTGVDPTGTPGTTGVVTFTVASDAPDDLWYYCSTPHYAMRGAIEIKDSGDDFFDTYPNNNAIRTVEVVRAAGAKPFGKGYTIGEQVQPNTESFNTSSPSAFIFKVASIDLSSTIDRGACLYVAEKLATLELKVESNEYVTFKNVPAGTFMPVLAKEIKTATLDSSGKPTIGDNDVITLY